MRVAFRLGEEYGVFDRPGGLAGIWGKIIREVGGWVGAAGAVGGAVKS